VELTPGGGRVDGFFGPQAGLRIVEALTSGRPVDAELPPSAQRGAGDLLAKLGRLDESGALNSKPRRLAHAQCARSKRLLLERAAGIAPVDRTE